MSALPSYPGPDPARAAAPDLQDSGRSPAETGTAAPAEESRLGPWGVRPRGSGAEPQPYTYKVMRVLLRQPDGSWRVHRTIWNESAADE